MLNHDAYGSEETLQKLLLNKVQKSSHQAVFNKNQSIGEVGPQSDPTGSGIRKCEGSLFLPAGSLPSEQGRWRRMHRPQLQRAAGGAVWSSQQPASGHSTLLLEQLPLIKREAWERTTFPQVRPGPGLLRQGHGRS